MNNKRLFALWGGLLIICAGLGFIPVSSAAGRVLLTAASLCCFAPPAILLYDAARAGDKKTILLVRNASLLSLGLTVLFLVLTVLFALGPGWLGTVLNILLTVVSSPMLASGYWALSLFAWACVLMVSLNLLKRR